MSHYDDQQAAKKERYAQLAQKLETRAKQLYELDRQEMERIPVGQPILIGHHSESSHRAAIARSHRRLNKMLELDKKAAYYRQKASFQSAAISDRRAQLYRNLLL